MIPSAVIWCVAAGGLVLATAPIAHAAGEPAPPAAAQSPAGTTAGPSPEVKQIFATQCSWCHGAWGLKADKGPKLAGTQMSEQQVEDRIRNGKQGYMPAFRAALNDQEIEMMAKYIKSLKAED